MVFFNGTIAEAVSLSKSKNAIFVVFVEGQNDANNTLVIFRNDENIRSRLETEDFVVIKVTSDSQAYLQFAEIYQVVPVPSIFFIGKTGTPLEIATDIMSTVDDLERKIDKVLVLAGKTAKLSNTATASTSLIEAEKSAQASISKPEDASAVDVDPVPISVAVAEADLATPSSSVKNLASNDDEYEIICDGDTCYKKPKDQSKTEELESEPINEPEAPKTSRNETADKADNPVEEAAVVKAENTADHLAETAADDEELLNDARKTIEQKRRERIEEEKRLEKEQELQRRRDGKKMQNLRDWQKEQELKELKENLLRDRMAEQEARERIRAQIAGDRAERAQRTATETAKATEQDAKAEEKLKSSNDFNNADSTRLQFRLPSGEQRMHIFNSEQILSDVRSFVKNELLNGTNIRDFYLATTYPRQEFTTNDDTKTLIELGLVPNAVVLVIGKESKINPSGIITRSGGIINLFSSFMFLLFSPFMSAFSFLRSFVAKRPGDGSTGAADSVAKRRNIDSLNLGPTTSRAATAGDIAGNALGRTASGGNIFNDSSSGNTNDSGNTQNVGSDNKPYRRFGGSNIHRLTDARKDSDDENATWNGNSTQQQ